MRGEGCNDRDRHMLAHRVACTPQSDLSESRMEESCRQMSAIAHRGWLRALSVITLPLHRASHPYHIKHCIAAHLSTLQLITGGAMLQPQPCGRQQPHPRAHAHPQHQPHPPVHALPIGFRGPVLCACTCHMWRSHVNMRMEGSYKRTVKKSWRDSTHAHV